MQERLLAEKLIGYDTSNPEGVRLCAGFIKGWFEARDIPTRVLVGTPDVLTPPSHARKLADHIRGAQLVVAPDAGHMLPLERDALVSGTLIHLARPHVAPGSAEAAAS